MPKAFDDWQVHAHRPIEKLTENLWRVEGDVPGMPLKRVMTVGKRSDGTWFVSRLAVYPAASTQGAMCR